MPFDNKVTHYRITLKPGDRYRTAIVNVYSPSNTLVLHFCKQFPPNWRNSYSSQNTQEGTEKRGQVYLPVEDYPHTIDLLRNEGPVFLYISGATNDPSFGITTNDEYIGEGEEQVEITVNV